MIKFSAVSVRTPDSYRKTDVRVIVDEDTKIPFRYSVMDDFVDISFFDKNVNFITDPKSLGFSLGLTRHEKDTADRKMNVIDITVPAGTWKFTIRTRRKVALFLSNFKPIGNQQAV